ncbi:hypothetical protein ACJMK2_003813 [Sinanodonta woodiana]|uniref:tRNA-splicing endonuclease subunit Sen34 n=1 Tax=Sinanodonta woodiana TaxID=1069815 RepID=A0ABD3Y188_SINWO
MAERKVKLHLFNGQCFIWNANDADVLRQEFHCVGCLVGCLPRAPRQNTHLGLPLQLLPEETTLLLEKGVAELISNADTLFDPNEKQLEEFKAHRKSSYYQQIDLFRAERRKEILQNLPKIIEGKRAKRQKVLEERHEAGENIDEKESEDEEEFNVDKVEIPPISEHHALVQLHTESPYMVTTQSSPPIWSYPSTDQERLRYSVFKDLWGKGYFITSGNKFGGDFLVYPGDPARYHSFFIAVCLPHDKKISALDIISLGRLGSNVKKTAVLCSTESDGKLCYSSLQWTGIS